MTKAQRKAAKRKMHTPPQSAPPRSERTPVRRVPEKTVHQVIDAREERKPLPLDALDSTHGDRPELDGFKLHEYVEPDTHFSVGRDGAPQLTDAAIRLIGRAEYLGRAVLTLAQARDRLRWDHAGEWDALRACCGGDPDERCRRGAAKALADTMGIPLNTVHQRLKRARKRMHDWMGGSDGKSEVPAAAVLHDGRRGDPPGIVAGIGGTPVPMHADPVHQTGRPVDGPPPDRPAISRTLP